MLQAHEQRVVEESNELSEKIEALESFICSSVWETLSREEKALLRVQLNAMETYSTVLVHRIAMFKGK